MCNDYGLKAPLSLINQRFGEVDRPLLFPEAAPNLGEREDIRPTETAPIVRAGPAGSGGAELVQRRWGFAPGRPKAPPVINFRSEGRRFGNGPGGGRCLIPASHFFEFTAPDPGAADRGGAKRALKSKWRFDKLGPDGAPDPLLCIAGLWRVAQGETPETFTMLTCAPGPDIAPIHDRQIVVLEPADWAAWLDGEADAVGVLLRPSPAGSFRVERVR